MAALLLGLTVLALGGVGGHAFVEEHDDATYVTANPHVLAGLTAESVAWAFTSVGYASNWHPLTWLSHMTDVQLFGLDAGWHHRVNLAFHLSNALLLFAVLARLTGSTGRSARVAALFAVPPLNAETVGWVAERKNLLSTCFWFLTLGAYVRYVRWPALARYLPVFLLLALGLMAKPMLVTVPFVLLLLDWWPLRRPLGPRVVLEKVPLLVLSVLSGVMTVLAQSGGDALVSLERLPAGQRAAGVLAGYAAYLRACVWPTGLSFFYPREMEAPLSPDILLSLAALVAVSVVTARVARKLPALLFGWLWFLGTLVPVIGVVQVGAQAWADRYAYVTVVGIFVMVAWGTGNLIRRPAHRRAAAALSVAAVAALALAARTEAGYWRDGGALYRRALEVNPRNWVAENNLGLFLMRNGRNGEALEHLRRAVAIKPNYTDGMFNLAGLELQGGRSDLAIGIYRRIVELRPQDQDAHFNLGTLLLQQGGGAEAVDHLREAVRLKPEDAQARANLAEALRRTGGNAAQPR